MSSAKWFMIVFLAMVFWANIGVVALLFVHPVVGVVVASVAIPFSIGIVKEVISDYEDL
jgi:hypothetical protein